MEAEILLLVYDPVWTEISPSPHAGRQYRPPRAQHEKNIPPVWGRYLCRCFIAPCQTLLKAMTAAVVRVHQCVYALHQQFILEVLIDE